MIDEISGRCGPRWSDCCGSAGHSTGRSAPDEMAKADGDLHRLCGGLQNVLQMFLDQLLNGQGWDIAGAANGHRNAPDTTAIGIG